MGHQAILKGADAALTFRNHPLSVLAPERAPRLIMTCEERVAAIKACGVGEVTVLDFTPELAALSPESFVSRYLASSVSRLPSSVLRCGANWRFGKGGTGDAAWLERHGYAVEVVPYAEYKGGPISSSRIRQCLESGAIGDANAMLGRKFQVSGFRFQGKGLGNEIGYPTVNLEVSERGSHESGESSRIVLRRGVYEVEVSGLRGIANYGIAPTMGDKAWKEPVLEIHFLGDPSVPLTPSNSCSSQSVSILRFIRPERKFSSVEELCRQIESDCKQCQEGIDAVTPDSNVCSRITNP